MSEGRKEKFATVVIVFAMGLWVALSLIALFQIPSVWGNGNYAIAVLGGVGSLIMLCGVPIVLNDMDAFSSIFVR